MNKLLAIVLVVVLSLGALVSLWFVLDESPMRGTIDAPAPEHSTPVQSAENRPLATPEITAVVQEPAPVAAAAVEASDEAARSDRSEVEASKDERTIVGRVRIPRGSPDDPSLRVVALEKSASPEDVYGKGELLAKLSEGKGEVALGSAEVNPDGTFALRLKASNEAWLVVDGRFLYSPRCEPGRAGDPSLELETELGACVSGTVRLPGEVTDAAKAFGELDIELSLDSADFSLGQTQTAPLFERGAKADAAGHFELRAVPTSAPRQISVRSDDHADWKKGGLALEPGRVLEVQVELEEGATLRGSVSDEGGRPVADASVHASEPGFWGFAGPALARTKTGADGTFVLEHVAPGKAMVLAECDGFLESEPQRVELVDGGSRDGLALTLSRGASVAGRVTLLDGAPASGAAVEVKFDPAALVGLGAMNAARGADGKTKAGEDGRFEVQGLGKGPFVVEAELERDVGGSKQPWRGKASGVASGTTDVAITLGPPCVLAGKVVGPDGAPVTRFHVRATVPSPMVYIPGESKEEEFDDADGAFVLRDLDAGTWQVQARADGFGPMASVEVVLPAVTEEPLVLTLVPAATAAGTVLDPDGNPAAGAKVTLQAEMSQRIQRLAGRIEVPEAVSGTDGTFVITGLAAGSCSLVAAREGCAASEPVPVEGRAGEQVSGLVLHLRHGATVSGEVYDAEGERAAGVRVMAQSSSTWEMSSQQADGEGLFRFEHLAPGSWTITALMGGNDDAVDEGAGAEDVTTSFMDNLRFTMVQLEENEEEHVVLGAPPKDPVKVHGRVTHGKEPLTHGLVSFMAEGSKGLEALKMTSVGTDGQYEAELAEPGRYMISVQVQSTGSGFQQQTIEFRETIPDGDEHTLDFALPLGGVRGRVRGPDHDPSSGARVTLGVDGGLEAGSLLGGNYSEATTDENGEYSFDFLRPGTYTVAAGGVVFGGALGGESKGGRLLRSGVRVEEGHMVEGIDFQLEEPGDLEGKVVDGAGAPVKDAAIFVRDSNGRVLDRFSMTASGADGAFHYTGIAPGEYLVSARKGTLASSESAPVRVRSHQKESVQIALFPGTKLIVEVLDDEGKLADARVSVVDGQGREMQGMIGLNELSASFSEGLNSKQFTIGPLPPGSYTVTATAPDGQRFTKPVVLDGQPERRLKVRLR